MNDPLTQLWSYYSYYLLKNNIKLVLNSDYADITLFDTLIIAILYINFHLETFANDMVSDGGLEVVGMFELCISLRCVSPLILLSLFDNNVSGWLKIAQWKWLITPITVCNICCFLSNNIYVAECHCKLEVLGTLPMTVWTLGISDGYIWEKKWLYGGLFTMLLVPGDGWWFRTIFTLVSKTAVNNHYYRP